MTDLKDIAIHRLEILTEEFQLSPSILNRFKENGTVYYSYITGFVIPSIDVINYHPEYEELAGLFEKITGFLVYHAIERNEHGHRILSLLFVDPDSTGEFQWRYYDSLIVFDYDFETDENGYKMLRVKASDPTGALIGVPEDVDS